MNNCSNCNNRSFCSQNRYDCPNSHYYITGSEIRNAVEVSNNQSRYYAELAEKYKNEAKELRDNAQYYAEQNSDVTKAYVDAIDAALRTLIAAKQDSGNYALSSEIPTKVSDLTNDSSFVSSADLGNAISAQALLTTAEINTSASGKANIDCDNLSATGKTKIVTLANELDWTNAISVSTTSSTSTQTYTTATDGTMFLTAFASGGTSLKRAQADFTVDAFTGTSGFYGNYINGYTATSAGAACSCHFAAGTIVTFLLVATGGSNNNQCQALFVPFKKS